MSNVAELTKKNSSFKYTSGGNVQAVWRKTGWTPPSEYREDYLFRQNREAAQGEIQ
jgi:hypothetical protein